MANYNSFVFTGHGTSEKTGGYDPGAVSGSNTEYKIAKQITDATKSYLSSTGLAIHYDENNFTDVDVAGNTYKNKCGVSIHINAGGGNGVEAYVPLNESYLGSDFKLCSDIAKTLGIPNRGVKSRCYNTGNTYTRMDGVKSSGTDYYGEIREAWSRGISLTILEVGFIDTSDIDKIKANISKLGLLIAQYVAANCDATITAPLEQSNIYRVRVDGTQVNAYREVSNILEEVEKAVKEGKSKIEIIRK